jgi:two-component system sensor histidine kinase AgrC
LKHSYLLQAFLYALLAIFLLLILEIYYFDMNPSTLSIFITGTTFLSLVLWLLNLRSFYKFTIEINKESIIQEADRLQLEESRKLTQTLSSQRHDFKNQLQVIRMLAQMNKSGEIVNYIQEYNKVMDLSNSIYGHINNPAISAMLLVFFTEAKEKGIRFSVDCDADFTSFSLSPVAVTRAVGNVIRNAIEVLELFHTPEGAIQITIWETSSSYNFIVWNNGPFIPDDHKKQLFKSGFSTKNSSGLGLSIAKQIVDELGGQITVESSLEKGTEFKIVFPKSISSVVLTEQPVKEQPVKIQDVII